MSKTNAPPPPVIPQSSVVALQAWKDRSKISNSNWENSLNVPITVNPGDSIFVKASFIDTRGTASGNIDLAVDTEISLEYYFYWIHNFSACNKSELISEPTQPDASNNLNQQVLVGPDIPTLFAYNEVIDPSGQRAPAYMCDPSGVFQATDINDADGLPYLVYQSSNNIPVPAVLGPVIPASEIVPGTTYVVHTAGISTNWEYAGIVASRKNILSPVWELEISPFVATNNPNGVTVPPASPFDTNPGMSPSAFLLPADVQATLPYVSYMITDVGNTDWVAIDPDYTTQTISAADMVSGSVYAIDEPGTIAWTVWGAANNNTGTEFTYTNPPPAPPNFDISLNNAFFLANANTYDSQGGPAFGASPLDFFECVIGITNFDSLLYRMVSFDGSGPWLDGLQDLAQWTIPPAAFGVEPTVCPGAGNLIITALTASVASNVPVANLRPSEQYTVNTTGFQDGSAPPFTWNMVSNLPTTDTSQMVAGNQYQVYEYNGQVISYAPHQGVLTDVFISQGPIAAPPPLPSTLIYDSSLNPLVFNYVTIQRDGVQYDMDPEKFYIHLEVTKDASGNCTILNGTSQITKERGGDFLEGALRVDTFILNPDVPGVLPALDVRFLSVPPDYTEYSVTVFGYGPVLTPFPSVAQVSLLVQLQALLVSPATYVLSDATVPGVEQYLTYQLSNPTITLLPGSFAGGGIFPFTVTVSADPGGSGYVYYQPYPTSVGVLDGYLGPSFVPYTPVSVLINGSFGDSPNFDVSFNVLTFSEDGTNIYTCGLGNQLFPTVLTPIPFIASGPFTGTGSTSTANATFGSLDTALATGPAYRQGSVFTGPPVVGSIIKSINPDPNPGSTGLAAEYPSPYTPYDGTVREVLTPGFNKIESRPVKKKWSMVLKAGSYNPNYLAELISRNMSRQKQKRVNNIQNSNFGTQSSLTVPTDSVYNNQSATPIWTQPISGGANVFYDSKNPAAYDNIPEPNYNLPPDNEDDMPFLFTPAMNSNTLLVNDAANPNGAQNNFIYAEIPHPNANGLNNLPPPTWYVNLVPLISDVRSISPTIQGSGTPYYSILPFYTQNAVVQSGDTVEGNSGVFPIVFGANQTSLLYNNENNGLFSFNYLHSPMYAFLSNQTSDLTEVTAHMYTTAKTGSNVRATNFFTTLVDKNSGILLNQMNPPGFWQQLGFRIEDLTVDLDGPQIGYQMKLADFQRKTTGGFCGSSNIFNPVFHTNNSAIQPSCPDTELVFATATPAAVPPSAIITAYTPNLTIGTVYRIIAPGSFEVARPPPELENDWSSVGGPIVDSGDDVTGSIFTATSSGFDPDNPPQYGKWITDPLVVPADFPESTTTILQSTYFQVENTNTLDARNIPTVRDATGHYLVELTGYNSNYIDDSSKREIKAIVSSYWVSPGAFVSVPFPDSYNFYGTGAPQTLSTIKTRILDPFTDKEAILGPNSSIYLQVNRMLSQAAEEQIN